MGQQILSVGYQPQVIIQNIAGDLQIKGWERPDVLLRSSDAAPALSRQGSQVIIASNGDCLLRLPAEASLTIETVTGSASIKDMEAGLEIRTVQGALELRNCGATRLGAVSGDLVARSLSGGLSADKIHGDAALRDMEGDCSLEGVSGSLAARDLLGDFSANVSGDASLLLSLLGGRQIALRTAGSLKCVLPDEASARVEIASARQRIEVRLREGTQVYHAPTHSLVLGGGEALVTLSAQGKALLACQAVSSEELPGEETDFSSAGFLPGETERILQQARAASERAQRQAQERMTRAQEKLEHKLENARRKAEAHVRIVDRRFQRRPSWNFEWSSANPAAKADPTENVSDDERLMILRMLEQKKISLEEAEKLLAALENK